MKNSSENESGEELRYWRAFNKKVVEDWTYIEVAKKWYSDEAKRLRCGHGFELHDFVLSFVDWSGNIIIEISHIFPNCCHSQVVIVADCGA